MDICKNKFILSQKEVTYCKMFGNWAFMKEDFLLKIEEQGIPVKKYVDDNEYMIIGLPFFNKDSRMDEFTSRIRSLL